MRPVDVEMALAQYLQLDVARKPKAIRAYKEVLT
jgi:hypothetical protein